MNRYENFFKLFPGRFVFGLILAAAAILLIGAGRIGDSMASRQAELENAQRQWKDAVRRVFRRDSAEPGKKTAIQKLAEDHPEYLLQAIHTGMRPDTGR